jgi:N-formylglutamate deformylase
VLASAVEAICAASGESHVRDGRFKGGWTTRHYGRPGSGIHAVQMELAIRGYHAEPEVPAPDNWPGVFDPDFAAPLTAALTDILKACIAFAASERTIREPH